MALCSLGTITQQQLGQHLVSQCLMNQGWKSEFEEKQRKIGWHLVRQDAKVIYNLLCNNCFWFLAVSDGSDLSACLVDALVLCFCSCKYSPCAGSAFLKKSFHKAYILCIFVCFILFAVPLSFRVEVVIYDFLEKEKSLKHFHKANFCVQKERVL